MGMIRGMQEIILTGLLIKKEGGIGELVIS